MLEKAKYSCFVSDMSNITQKLGMNLIGICISRRFPPIESSFEPIDENILKQLADCLNAWNIKEYRIKFADIMEEHVRNN